MVIFGKKRSEKDRAPKHAASGDVSADTTDPHQIQATTMPLGMRPPTRPGGFVTRMVSNSRSHEPHEEDVSSSHIASDAAPRPMVPPPAAPSAAPPPTQPPPRLPASSPPGVPDGSGVMLRPSTEEPRPPIDAPSGSLPVPMRAPPAAPTPSTPERARQPNVVYPWGKKYVTMNPPRFLDESRRPPPGVLSPPPFPRYGHATNQATGANQEVYIFGGLVRDSVKNDMYIMRVEPVQIQRSSGIKMDIALQATLIQTSGHAPLPRVGHAAVLVSNVFILWGGDTKIHAEDRQDDALYLLNLNNREWTRVAAPGVQGTPGPVGRYGHTLSMMGSNLVVFGGQLDDQYFNELWRFDLNTLKDTPVWELVQPPTGGPPRRAGHSAVVYKDRLYIFGGTDGQFHYNDTWCWDFATMTWSELKCVGYIPMPREGHSACMIDDIMYIFGGRGADGKDLGDLASFKISSHRWFMFAHMGPAPFGRSGHTMVSVQNRILVVGGEAFSGDAQDEPTGLHVLDTSKIKYPVKTERSGSSAPKPSDEHGAPPATPGSTVVPAPPTPSTPGQAPLAERSGPVSEPVPVPEPLPPTAPMTQGTPLSASSQYSPPATAPSVAPVPASAATVPSPRPPRPASPVKAPEAPLLSSPDAAAVAATATATTPVVPPGSTPLQSDPADTPQAHFPVHPRQLFREDDASSGSSSREMWLATTLALAVKQGFVPPARVPGVDEALDVERLDTGAEHSAKEALVKSVMSLKLQVTGLRADLQRQLQHEEERVAVQERARVAALQEAAFYRAKLSAHELHDTDERARLDRQRIFQLEKLVGHVKAEHGELERKVSMLTDQTKLEARLRQLAEDRLAETTRRALSAEESQLKVYEEYSALQKHMYETEASLRDHAAQISTLTSRFAAQQVERDALDERLGTATRTIDTNRSMLTQFQEALTAAHTRLSDYERQHGEQQRQNETQNQLVLQLRAELQAKAAELDMKSEQLEHHMASVAELESMVQSLQHEAQKHREAATGGLAQLLSMHAPHDASSGADATRDTTASHHSHMQALQDETQALRQLHEESRASLSAMATTLQQATERSTQLQRTNNQLFSEMSAQRKQLSAALHELSTLRDRAQVSLSEDEQHKRDMEAAHIRNEALRQLLHEHRIDVPDDDTLARPEFMQSRKVLELQRELEVHKRTAELNALDLQRAQEQLHHMSQEWEVRRLQGASSRQELETLRLRAEQAERQLIEATEAHDQRTSQLENDYLTAVQFVRNTENMLRRLKDEHNKLRHDNAELRVLAAGQSPHAPLSSTRTFRSP